MLFVSGRYTFKRPIDFQSSSPPKIQLFLLRILEEPAFSFKPIQVNYCKIRGPPIEEVQLELQHIQLIFPGCKWI